jgi:HSP20 family protein
MALIRRKESQEGLAPNRAWDPFQMMDELMRWDPFQGLSWAGSARPGSGQFAPAFDVHESDDAFVFSADLPGISEDSLELSLTGNRLTISGHREQEKRQDGDRVHMYERSYGAFSRSFALPDGVDSDRIDAQLDAGVLKVTVPKRPEVKPRRISIGKLLRSSNKA